MMGKLLAEVWFWQRIISPHMVWVAVMLARQGYSVTYVTEQEMTADRLALGWKAPEAHGIRLEIASTASRVRELASSAPADAMHICQGIRANGLVGVAQAMLAGLGRSQWTIMETIDDSGLRGGLKRMLYRYRLRKVGREIEGVLAIGARTPDWVRQRGVDPERIYPFAYFLPEVGHGEVLPRGDHAFRVLFVGQFIRLKRLDLLIDALVALENVAVELVVAGSGPLERELRSMAERKLGAARVHWLGRLDMAEIPTAMAAADCLVLPSRHDGWGAVVSEALLAGTQAVCSDACGAAAVVAASRVGGVFASGDVNALADVLSDVVQEGALDGGRRAAIREWARCLAAPAGASYLSEALEHRAGRRASKPLPPWEWQVR